MNKLDGYDTQKLIEARKIIDEIVEYIVKNYNEFLSK